MKTIKITEKNI